jgi:hypothetical protein
MSTLRAAIGKRHFGRGVHDMVYRLVFAGLLLSATATSRALPSIDPETVEIRSRTLHLKGYLWEPSGTGPFPAVLVPATFAGGNRSLRVRGAPMVGAATDRAD